MLYLSLDLLDRCIHTSVKESLVLLVHCMEGDEGESESVSLPVNTVFQTGAAGYHHIHSTTTWNLYTYLKKACANKGELMDG